MVRTRRARRSVPPPARIELVAAHGSAGSDALADRVAVPTPVLGPDLCEVRGQIEARRGLEIALAGGHGLLLIGPPGSGKPNYHHTPEDTLDKVSAQSLKVVGDVAYSLITGAQD